MKTSNPALNEKLFSEVRTAPGADVMTLDGTVNKAMVSILITVAAGWWAFSSPAIASMFIPLLIVSLIIAVIICFKKTLAPVLTIPYAVAEGMLLGGISSYYAAFYDGIITQAVSLTFATLFCMLFLYRSGWIKVTDKFRTGIMAATGAIFIFYMVALVLSLFGVHLSFLSPSNGSLFSIGISVVVVAIAALNLVLDFDLIDRGAKSGSAPKYMEWYGAFALLVTLVWLYLEILRLLAKLNSRD